MVEVRSKSVASGRNSGVWLQPGRRRKLTVMTKSDRPESLAGGAAGRWLRTVGCAAAAIWLLGNTDNDRVPLTRDQLVGNFEIIIFHNEFDSQTDVRLRKWVSPVRIYLDIRAGDRKTLEATVQDHIQHLVRITGYDIALTDDTSEANVFVVFEIQKNLGQIRREYFSPKFDLIQVMLGQMCIGQYRSNGGYEITKAVVVMPDDRALANARVRACVFEEVTQILGLPNASDEVVPSVFNDHTPDVELTSQDILLVRLLFDQRLSPEMPRLDALDTVRQILEEMGYTGPEPSQKSRPH